MLTNVYVFRKYFYPVQQGVYVATNHRIKDKTPAQMVRRLRSGYK
jgi:hypothetical protein